MEMSISTVDRDGDSIHVTVGAVFTVDDVAAIADALPAPPSRGTVTVDLRNTHTFYAPALLRLSRVLAHSSVFPVVLLGLTGPRHRLLAYMEPLGRLGEVGLAAPF
jgi:hypothetical protein